MATFSPFGLQGDLSTSAASQANPTLLTFPWDPTVSGWSGDVAISYLPGNGGNTVNSTDGYVYPAFIATNVTIPSGLNSIWYPPIVGVITGFKYKPANNALTPNDTWPSYDKDTVLQPNSGGVQVVVNTDAQARYKIQYKGTTQLPGLTSNFLFGGASLGAPDGESYIQTFGANTYTFVRGTPNTSTASAQGLEPGTSRMCLVEPVSISSSLSTAQLSRQPAFPLFIMKPNNFDNSGWWSAQDPDLETNANTVVGVMLNQCFINTNWTPVFQQNPVYS